MKKASRFHYSNVKIGQLILLLGLVIVFIPPILTSPAILSVFELGDKSQIGDIIGGVTSPFISAIGAILVFIAFKEQVKANTIIREQQFIQFIQDELHRIEDDTLNTIGLGESIIKGRIACTLNRLAASEKEVWFKFTDIELNKLFYLISIYDQSLLMIEGLSSEYQEVMRRKLSFLYILKHKETFKILCDLLEDSGYTDESQDQFIADLIVRIQLVDKKLNDIFMA